MINQPDQFSHINYLSNFYQRNTKTMSKRRPRIFEINQVTFPRLVVSTSRPLRIKYRDPKNNISNNKFIPFYLVLPKTGYQAQVQYEKLQLRLQTTPPLKKFFQDFDQQILDWAEKYQEQWFSEEVWDADRQELLENYRSSLRADFLKFNLTSNHNQLREIVYDATGQLLASQDRNPFQELAFSNYRASLLLKCTGIWLQEEAFGVSWQVEQIKLFPELSPLPEGSQFLQTWEEVAKHPATGLLEQCPTPSSVPTSTDTPPAVLSLESPSNTLPDTTPSLSETTQKLKNYLLDD